MCSDFFSEERLKHWNSDYHTTNMGDSIAVPFAKYLDKFRDKDVLEIGPGDGRQAVWAWALVKSYSIADISENVLFDPVFKRDGLRRYLIESYKDDFKVQFDLIHFWYVLHHVLPSELPDFFGFVHRHSRGEIMFNTPYLDHPAPAYKDNGVLTSRHTIADVSRATKGLFELVGTDGSLYRNSNGLIVFMRKEG